VTLCRSKPWTGRPRCRALSNSPWILGAPAWVPPSGEAFERKPRSIVISRENFAMGSVTRLAHPLEDIVPLSTQSARQAAAVVARLRQDGTELEFELEENFARMTPIGTPELVLLLVALGGMTAAATWAVIELKKPRR